MKKYVSKKRKLTSKTKKPYKKSEKTNKWAPKISTKEYKYIDNVITATSLSTPALGGQVVWINPINQGAYAMQRIGNVCKMKTLHLKAWITVAGNPTVPVLPNIVRMAVVYDAQYNSAATPAALDQVFQAVTSSGATEISVFSGVNISNRSRFTILRDYIRGTPRIDYQDDNTTPKHVLDVSSAGAKGDSGSCKSGQTMLIEDFIQVNMPVVFITKPTGAITDLATGGLFLYMYCGGQSGNWVITHASRLTFKEEQTN